MIKVETLGMLDNAKVNPVLKSNNTVANYTFLTDDGVVYLISNTVVGDDSYKDDMEFAAGEFLNGFAVKAWEGQKLVADEKHIAYGSGETYASITAGTTLMTINSDGKLAITASAPTSGIYFKVTDKTTLTEKAIKIRVIVVDKDTVYTAPSGQ